MEIFIVGGAVRDKLRGIVPKDIDYVVVGSCVSEMLNQGFNQVGADFPVFLHPETNAEYALARTERKSGTGYTGFATETNGVTLEEDLGRRDLTINAMAMDDAGNLFDPFGGQADLEARVLRHVSPSFTEDPLRVLRVARFMARFGRRWSIAPETMTLMRDMVSSGRLDELVAERVWVEVEKGLREPYPELMIDVLAQLNAFKCPPLKEYACGLVGYREQLQLAAKSGAGVAVRFALAFPREWNLAEIKVSRIPRDVRETSHGLVTALNIGLGEFSQLTAERKVLALMALDALRQKERMSRVLEALEFVHPGQAAHVTTALNQVLSLDNSEVIASASRPSEIPAKLLAHRIKAVEQAERR